MRTLLRSPRSALLALALVAIPLVAVAASRKATPSLPQDPPSIEDVSRETASGAFSIINEAACTARGSAHVNEQLAKVRWMMDVPGYSGTLKITQVLPVSYYPTAVNGISGDNMLVAGVSPITGNTLVEIWTLQRPLVVWDLTTGKPRLVSRSPRRKVLLYDEAVVGRSIVTGFMIFPGSSEKFMARYSDSKAIYELSVSGQAPVLVASPDPQTSGEYVSELSSRFYDNWWSGTHVSEGHVCIMGASLTEDPEIALIDADMDFSTDYCLVMDDAAWESTGFGKRSQFVD